MVFISLNPMKSEVQDLPWPCDGCGTPFERYEDMNFHTHPCGCKAEFCTTCYEGRYGTKKSGDK